MALHIVGLCLLVVYSKTVEFSQFFSAMVAVCICHGGLLLLHCSVMMMITNFRHTYLRLKNFHYGLSIYIGFTTAYLFNCDECNLIAKSRRVTNFLRQSNDLLVLSISCV